MVLILLLVGLVAGVGLAYLLHIMSGQDAEQARFLANGRSISSFLKSYEQALFQSYETREFSQLMQHYSQDYLAPGRGSWNLTPKPNICNTSVSVLESSDDLDMTLDALQQELGSYLDAMSSVDQVRCKINLIEEIEFERRALVSVKFVLDGKDRTGRIFQDRHFFRWHLAYVAQAHDPGEWRIVRDELIEGIRVAGQGRGFHAVDVQEVGLNYQHRRDPGLDPNEPDVHLKFTVMEYASGGVSSVDYDRDGWPDLFFADGRRSRLFRNTGPSETLRVSFADVTHEAELDGIGHAHAAYFGDVDNDGDGDLFVARYLVPSKFYRNNGNGTFTDESESVGLDFVETSASACFLDYDKDGFVDLYVANYANAFEVIPNVPFFAENAHSNRLYRNLGGKRFIDVTEEAGVGDRGWSLAVSAGDINSDGDIDLAVANDMGRKCIFRNNGNGTFTEVAKQAGMLDFSGGMGVALADVNDDGWMDCYMSNINSNQRWFGEEATTWQYARNLLRTKWIFQDFGQLLEAYSLLGSQWRELGKMIGEGNSLFYNNGDATFVELKDSHTNRAGWSWGVGFFDMDNDTDLDIYAANGWISGKNKDDL